MNANSVIGQSLENYDLHAKISAGAMRALPNNRSYAIDDTATRGGVALMRAFIEEGKGEIEFGQDILAALLGRTAPYLPTLTQSWKPGPNPPPPKPWVDPVTGKPLPNPFADPRDLEGQSVLLSRDPALAAHFKAMAANPYATLTGYADEAKRRAQLNAITYTAKDHETNPYRFDDLTAQALFRQTQGDLVADIWKQEASPIRLPWSSDPASIQRTIQGQILTDLNEKPFHGLGGDLILRAAQIDSALAKAIHADAADEAAKAAERANQLAREARRGVVRQ